jgi:hypothetical protein
MTLLITFSSRFLLILEPERARRLGWGVATNPARVSLELGNALERVSGSKLLLWLVYSDDMFGSSS